MADQLARKGADGAFMELEPFCAAAKKKIRAFINQSVKKKSETSWMNCPVQKQTYTNGKIYKDLLNLGRNIKDNSRNIAVRISVGVLTGHCGLSVYMHIIIVSVSVTRVRHGECNKE